MSHWTPANEDGRCELIDAEHRDRIGFLDSPVPPTVGTRLLFPGDQWGTVTDVQWHLSDRDAGETFTIYVTVELDTPADYWRFTRAMNETRGEYR